MIRDASLSDIPAMLELGKRFADDAGVTDWVEWDADSVTAMLVFLIEDDNGICLVTDGGMFGGFVFPHEFNKSVLVFKEVFWRAERGGGVRMLKRAEAWAKAKGARLSGMFAPIRQVGGDVGPLYQRLGYAPSERIYMKEL